MSVPKSRPDLEDIEVSLLIEGLYRYCGFDFRNYAVSSLKRRIWNLVQAEKLSTISGLQEKLFHDPACLERFLLGVSVNVTAMFRDPSFYLAFRRHVIPILRTYPFVRIWHAGCSSGEEVYSLAILLEEEGLYSRCQIYATDMNEVVLQKAAAGIFPLRLMQEYTQNYIRAGGKRSFSEYYTANSDSAIFRASLREKVIFSPHNLVTDGSFNEFNVILCRNVLIYFNQTLQNQVHQLLHDSLTHFGILGLGHRESLKTKAIESRYGQLVKGEKLYRRID